MHDIYTVPVGCMHYLSIEQFNTQVLGDVRIQVSDERITDLNSLVARTN